MNLKAIIPAGQTEITVNGLFQWDYGRKLEIYATDIPALVEVHFSCPGMDEAIVRVGSAVDGVVTVAIPDRCLEQSAPITAWIFEVGESYGQTIKTLTLNITKRTRPQATGSIDPENSDKYTEAIAAMNEAVETLKNGDLKVKEAEKATNDSEGEKISDSYLRRRGGIMTGPTYYWQSADTPALPEFEEEDTPSALVGVGDWEALDEENMRGGYPLKRIAPEKAKVGRATNDGEGNNIAETYLSRGGGIMLGPTYYWTGSLSDFDEEENPEYVLGVGAFEDMHESGLVGGRQLKARKFSDFKVDALTADWVDAGEWNTTQSKTVNWAGYEGTYLVRLEIPVAGGFPYSFIMCTESKTGYSRSNIVPCQWDGVYHFVWLECRFDKETNTKTLSLMCFDDPDKTFNFKVYWKRIL